MKKSHYIYMMVLAMLMLTACSNKEEEQTRESNDIPASKDVSTEELSAEIKMLTRDWKTDWEKHTISYDELISGGPPRDGIPSLDQPEFESVQLAEKWLAPTEPVMVVDINGDSRAYPLQILIWHEIVNDIVGGKPVLVSFCPLCNSAIVFDRNVNGEAVEFGTSGLLVQSDLVMYDRKTETLWQQFTGEAIIGELVGKEPLTMLPSSLVSFADFTSTYPDGLVLSKETGYDRRYGQNPYPGYDQRTTSFFDREQFHSLLPAMERVVTIAMTDEDKAYPYTVLTEKKVVHDQIGSSAIVIFFKKGTNSALSSQVIERGSDVGSSGVYLPEIDQQSLTFQPIDGGFVDNETGSTWNILGRATAGPLKGRQLDEVVHGDHFWFSWIAFKPETKVYTE
ncbi:DUF3179 domain-containing protein [Bacillus sp. 2205SS5-2]|uniref:DUF3179 domain-containing protein n=1 Tax=Bacillus sp. 2205SS5-2 TaxID=3109031 RepID=UPI003005BF4E